MIKKQQARNLYFQTELTQAKIAELLDVNRKTVYLWVKEGRWKEIKKSASHMPSVLAEQYYGQLLAINEMIAARTEQPYPTKDEADVIRKLTLTIKHIKNTPAVTESIDVLMNFVHSIKTTDAELAKQVMSHAEDYIGSQVDLNIIRSSDDEDELFEDETEIEESIIEQKEEQSEEVEESKEEANPLPPVEEKAAEMRYDWDPRYHPRVTYRQAVVLYNQYMSTLDPSQPLPPHIFLPMPCYYEE